MRKKLLITTLLIILVVTLSTTLISCAPNHKANKIQFEKLSLEELNANALETKDSNKMTLVENNNTLFKIVVDNEIDSSLLRSVNELKLAIKGISDIDIPIVNKDSITSSDTHKILIGNVSNVSTSNIKNDGFSLSIQDNQIDIKGLDQLSTSNGIYTFIEDYLGCMFISPSETFYPSHKDIYLEKVSTTINPVTPWRSVYANEIIYDFWSAKLRLNGVDSVKSDEEILSNVENVENLTTREKYIQLLEKRQYTGWGTWCHDCYQYVSPDVYFDEHPEYFSLKKGQRVHRYADIDAQLCLSNPEVYEIISDSLNKKIAENPDAKYWDFSGNDNWAVYGCECKDCKKLDKAAGGTGMGSLIPVLNKLAKEHPDKYISSLAYFHTIKPPTNDIKLEDNVVIKLCSMPGDQGTSYLNPGNKTAKEFHDLVKDWSKISNKIVVWDYVVNFSNLLLPFPNFAVQQENQKFYEDNNIQGVFHQASREIGGEMGYLRSYVLSKLMWEGSSMDVSKCVSKYIQLYYGDAADEVFEYLNTLSKNLSDNTSSLGLYDSLTSHVNGYLSKDAILDYEKIIAKAKEKVKDNKKYADRIDAISMSINYAKAVNPKIHTQERKNALASFNEQAKTHDVTMVSEWESLEDFNGRYDSFIKEQSDTINRPIYITFGVIFGVIVLILACYFLIKTIKNRTSKIK